jgi:hypothetical protein
MTLPSANPRPPLANNKEKTSDRSLVRIQPGGPLQITMKSNAIWTMEGRLQITGKMQAAKADITRTCAGVRP